MKTAFRWLSFLMFFATLFGVSSTRCEAKAARTWPCVSQTTVFASPSGPRFVQYLLRARGYKISADGIWGKQTTSALRSFQRRHSLKTNGQLNAPTWEALVVSLKRGSRGDAVRAIQITLTDVYAVSVEKPAKPTGKFDFDTELSLRKYQEYRNLTVDGIVGLETWCSLAKNTVYEAGD